MSRSPSISTGRRRGCAWLASNLFPLPFIVQSLGHTRFVGAAGRSTTPFDYPLRIIIPGVDLVQRDCAVTTAFSVERN